MNLSRESLMSWRVEPINQAQARLDATLKTARTQARTAREETDELQLGDELVPPDVFAREGSALKVISRLAKCQAKGTVPVRVIFNVYGRTGSFEVARKVRHSVVVRT